MTKSFTAKTGWAVAAAALLLAAAVAMLRGEDSGPPAYIAEGVQAQSILSRQTMEQFGASIGPDFAVTSRGSILLQSGNRLIEVIRQTAEEIEASQVAEIADLESFALDGDGLLWTVGRTGLGRISAEGGKTVIPFTFDARNTHVTVSATRKRLYLWGGGPAGLGRNIMSVSSRGVMEHLAAAEQPISSVAENKEGLVFATARAIYQIAGSELRLVIRVPEPIEIVSVATPWQGGVLYFASKDRVYALKGLLAVSVAMNLGGTLQFRDGALYVLDSGRRELVRLTRLDSL